VISLFDEKHLSSQERRVHEARCFTGLVPFIFLVLLLPGCGAQAPPRPITKEAPPQVKNLGVKVRPAGVELDWTIPDQLLSSPKDAGYSFSVLRSDLSWENRSCPDCPALSQQEILRIQAAHPDPAQLQGKDITWVDPNVSPDHAYRYQVAVLDNKDRRLSLSAPAIAKVLTPPPTPSHLVAVTERQGILLRWKEPKKDLHGRPFQGELQFLVERQTPKGGWETLSNVPANGNTFLDPAVASGQLYNYRVYPVIAFEQTSIFGEPAVIHNAKAPAALPPPPPNTVWVIPAKGGLEVHWIQSEGKVSGYYVYRRQDKEIVRLTASPVKRPPYLDRSAKANSVYYYAVSSVSAQPDQKEGLLSKWVEIKSFLMDK
jgi:hypothetical protein